MRFLLAVIISFQFISAPVAAELGEKKPFTSKEHLLSQLAFHEASEFETLLREQLQSLSVKGSEATTASASEEEKGLFKKLNKDIRPVFIEKRKGYWETTVKGQKISFTSADIYEGNLFINGNVFKFKDVPMSGLEQEVEKKLQTKTSLIQKIFQESLGIQSAHADFGVSILIIAAVVGLVAFLAKMIWENMNNPKKLVKQFTEMKNKLESDANSCENAQSDPSAYMDTFNLTNSVSSQSPEAKIKTPSEALTVAVRTGLERSNRKSEDCFQIMSDAGNKANLKIPIPNSNQIERRAALGSTGKNEEFSVMDAAFNLCDSYNKLTSCMGKFVAAHVNDSGISSFKEKARADQYEYKKNASGASAQ